MYLLWVNLWWGTAYVEIKVPSAEYQKLLQVLVPGATWNIGKHALPTAVPEIDTCAFLILLSELIHLHHFVQILCKHKML